MTRPWTGSSPLPAGCSWPTWTPAVARSASRPAETARGHAALCLRPARSALPPLPDADRGHSPGDGPAAVDLLVPVLPGRARVTDIAVACVGADGAWVCSVRVQDEHSATDHVVSVDEIDLPPALDGAELVDIERLLVATFEFLLEREPKESILARFDLDVVERYFPDYPVEMARRVTA